MKGRVKLGTVSHATMRPEDLIPAFLQELKYYHVAHGLGSISTRMKRKDYFESDEAQEDLEALFDQLDSIAPSRCYFGTHPGDGSDYGFWPSEEIEQDMKDDDCPVVADLADVPVNYAGEVLEINDHGNMTLYYKGRNGRFYERWSVV